MYFIIYLFVYLFSYTVWGYTVGDYIASSHAIGYYTSIDYIIGGYRTGKWVEDFQNLV